MDIYTERAFLIAFLSRIFPAAIEQHVPAEGEVIDPQWENVVYVQTPAGQLSWHISLDDMHLFGHLPNGMHVMVWDGHTTEEKYQRLNKLRGTDLNGPCGPYSGGSYASIVGINAEQW